MMDIVQRFYECCGSEVFLLANTRQQLYLGEMKMIRPEALSLNDLAWNVGRLYLHLGETNLTNCL